MVLIIILLFIIGVFAILAEAFLPFGISAVLGFLVIGLSCYLAFTEFEPALAAIYCVMALLVAIITARVVVTSGLEWLKLRSPWPGRLAKRSSPSAKEDPPLGAEAVVIQPLRPTGTIEWRERRLPARTLRTERETPMGAKVRIRGRDSTFWLVEEIADADRSDAALHSA